MPDQLAARTRIEQHLKTYERLVAQSRKYLRRRRYASAATYAELAAYYATWRHCGRFVDLELEQILSCIGRQAIPAVTRPEEPVQPGWHPRRVLHIGTLVTGIGGLARLLWRWIREDPGRTHSVALTRLSPRRPTPDQLRQAVQAAGGRIHNVDPSTGGVVQRATRLRELAASADLVVLHIETEDVVPIIALGHGPTAPPVVFVNNADHAFWLGASVSDLVVNLRRSGLRLCQERRGMDPERLVLIPTPVDAVTRTLSRDEAKQRLGLAPDNILLLSIARARKFRPLDGRTFAEAHVPALQRHGRAVLMVVGPDESDEWRAARQRTGGRVRVVAERADTEVFYQAADIYVDSYPIVSITSLLEAGSYGLPLVSRVEHSEASAVLAADAPGLEGVLTRARGLDEYDAALDRLIADGDWRLRTGARTREHILALHTGQGWRRALDDVYAAVVTAVGTPRRSGGDLSRPPSELDLLLPDVYGEEKELWEMVYPYRRALPLDSLSVSLFVRRLVFRPDLAVPAWADAALTSMGLRGPIRRILHRVRRAWSGR